MGRYNEFMRTIYRNCRLLDGTENMTVREDMCVAVEDGKIVKIGKDLKGDRDVDLSGKYLMPGLINMHVHIPANGFPKEKETDNKKLVRLVTKTKLTQKLAKKLLCDPNMKTQLFSSPAPPSIVMSSSSTYSAPFTEMTLVFVTQGPPTTFPFGAV